MHVRTYTFKRTSLMALVVKNTPANSGDIGSVPVLGRSPGGGHGNPLQYSCLENSMDRGVWQAIVQIAKNQTGLKELSRHEHIHKHPSLHTYKNISGAMPKEVMPISSI